MLRGLSVPEQTDVREKTAQREEIEPAVGNCKGQGGGFIIGGVAGMCAGILLLLWSLWKPPGDRRAVCGDDSDGSGSGDDHSGGHISAGSGMREKIQVVQKSIRGS